MSEAQAEEEFIDLSPDDVKCGTIGEAGLMLNMLPCRRCGLRAHIVFDLDMKIGRKDVFLSGPCPGCNGQRKARLVESDYLGPPPRGYKTLAHPAELLPPGLLAETCVRLSRDSSADFMTMPMDLLEQRRLEAINLIAVSNELVKFYHDDEDTIRPEYWREHRWPAGSLPDRQQAEAWQREAPMLFQRIMTVWKLRKTDVDAFHAKFTASRVWPVGSFSRLQEHSEWAQRRRQGRGRMIARHHKIEDRSFEFDGSAIEFEKIQFSNVTFRYCKFEDAFWADVDVTNSGLGACYFERASITGGRWTNSGIISTHFHSVVMKHVVFDNCSFKNSDWERARIEDGVLRNFTTRGSILDASIWRRCDFTGADFSDTFDMTSNLDNRASIIDVTFEDCVLRGTRWGRVEITGTVFRRCTFRNEDGSLSVSGPPVAWGELRVEDCDITHAELLTALGVNDAMPWPGPGTDAEEGPRLIACVEAGRLFVLAGTDLAEQQVNAKRAKNLLLAHLRTYPPSARESLEVERIVDVSEIVGSFAWRRGDVHNVIPTPRSRTLSDRQAAVLKAIVEAGTPATFDAISEVAPCAEHDEWLIKTVEHLIRWQLVEERYVDDEKTKMRGYAPPQMFVATALGEEMLGAWLRQKHGGGK